MANVTFDPIFLLANRRVEQIFKLLFASSFLFFQSEGKNLGSFGETFKIAEPDLIEQIYSRLSELKKGGKLEAAELKIREKAIEEIRNPAPVEGLQHTETPRTFEFDPTIVLTRDLKDGKGKIFARKGDRFNPLDRILMTKVLLFIDGDEEKQIGWALDKIKNDPAAKVILVKGSPLKLQERLDRPIYFDQYGTLATTLGIKHVPAIAFQEKEKKVLTVKEERAPANSDDGERYDEPAGESEEKL
jgi:conjugal transfer pilus assembly protein TraW